MGLLELVLSYRLLVVFIMIINNTNMAKQIFEHLSNYFSQDSARKEMELGLNHLDGTINGLPNGKLITVIGQSVDGRDIMLNTLVKNIAVDQRIPSLILNLATLETGIYFLHAILSQRLRFILISLKTGVWNI